MGEPFIACEGGDGCGAGWGLSSEWGPLLVFSIRVRGHGRRLTGGSRGDGCSRTGPLLLLLGGGGGEG